MDMGDMHQLRAYTRVLGNMEQLGHLNRSARKSTTRKKNLERRMKREADAATAQRLSQSVNQVSDTLVDLNRMKSHVIGCLLEEPEYYVARMEHVDLICDHLRREIPVHVPPYILPLAKVKLYGHLLDNHLNVNVDDAKAAAAALAASQVDPAQEQPVPAPANPQEDPQEENELPLFPDA